MLTSTELRQRLKISQPKLTAWIREGLPWEGTVRKKLFEPLAVRKWLETKGYGAPEKSAAQTAAEEDGPIYHTRESAALALGIAPRTLASWCQHPDFPGEAGHRGRREAYYPLGAIRRWHAKAFPGQAMEGTRNPARERKENAYAEIAEIDLAVRKGELISLQEVISFYARQMNQARAHLDDLADMVCDVLPPSIKKDQRQRIRDRVDEIRDQVLETFVELLKGDRDPTDEED